MTRTATCSSLYDDNEPASAKLRNSRAPIRYEHDVFVYNHRIFISPHGERNVYDLVSESRTVR